MNMEHGWRVPKSIYSRFAIQHSPLTSDCLHLVVETEMKTENGKQKTSVICMTRTTTNQTGRKTTQDLDDDDDDDDDGDDAGPLDCWIAGLLDCCS